MTNIMPSILTRAVLASIALVFTESILRVHAPVFARPSTLMNSTAVFIAEWAYWLGYQAARITDLYYLIKTYIGNDVVVLLMASWHLVKAPFDAVCGYIAYYAPYSNVQWILSAVMLCSFMCGIKALYPAPFEWLGKRMRNSHEK